VSWRYYVTEGEQPDCVNDEALSCEKLRQNGKNPDHLEPAAYVAAPTVKRITPTNGSAVGGTTVTVTGTHFTGASAVSFGSVHATSFTVVSAKSISAVSPAQAAGIVDVTVTTQGGTSAVNSEDRFKYTPTITGVSPSSGPVAGGTSVIVTGTGFATATGATTVRFGAVNASKANCSSSTTCTVVAPAHKAETVAVHATVNGVVSPKAPADTFTFE
jgi:IPT/TIG domain